MSGRTTGSLAPLEVRTISVEGKLVALKRTISAECIVRKAKGKAHNTVTFRFRYLGLRGKGATRAEAWTDFDRRLHALLDLLRDEPIEPQRIELRDRLLEYVDPEEVLA